MASGGSLIPILTYDEVISHCKGFFGLQITEEDLRKPNPQFVRKFYLDSVTKILQIQPEQMVQPNFQLLSEFQQPSVNDDAMPLVVMTAFLQRFMRACRVLDFQMRDLILPKPKRTLFCISAVINFAMFQGSQNHVYTEVMAEQETIKTQRKQLLQRNKELKNRLAEFKIARAKDEEQVQQLLPEVDQCEKVVHDLNRQQFTESKEIQQLKTDMAERASKEAEIKVTIASDKDSIEKLKAQIVTSPDKFRAEINKLDNAIATCKTSISEKTQTMQGLKNQLDSIAVLEEDLLQVNKLMASVAEEAEKYYTNQKLLQEVRDTVANNEEILREKNDMFQNVKRQLMSHTEKLSRLEMKNSKKVASSNFVIQQTEKELEICRNSMEDVNSEIAELDMRCKQIIKEIHDYKAKREDEMECKIDLYQQLLDQLQIYNNSLGDAWERLAQSLVPSDGQ